MAGSYLASFNTDRCRRSSEYSFFGINKDPAYSAQVYSLGVSCFFAPGIFRYLHREHQRCRCTVVGSPQHLEYCFHYYHFSLLVKLVGYWTPMLEDGFFVSTTDGRRNNLEVRVWSRQWPCIYSPGYPLGVSWFAQQIHFIVGIPYLQSYCCTKVWYTRYFVVFTSVWLSDWLGVEQRCSRFSLSYLGCSNHRCRRRDDVWSFMATTESWICSRGFPVRIFLMFAPRIYLSIFASFPHLVCTGFSVQSDCQAD